jgi:hypothetical protein
MSSVLTASLVALIHADELVGIKESRGQASAPAPAASSRFVESVPATAFQTASSAVIRVAAR